MRNAITLFAVCLTVLAIGYCLGILESSAVERRVSHNEAELTGIKLAVNELRMNRGLRAIDEFSAFKREDYE
jgi:hypothetical protein